MTANPRARVLVALGATMRDLLEMVMRQGAFLATAGCVLGCGVALALARYLESLVFGVTTSDVTTYVVVAVVLMAVSSTACPRPAWASTRIDPTVALRSE